VAHPREDDCQINSQSGLADSPLAGTYGDDGVNARERLWTWLLLAGMMRMSAQKISSTRNPIGPHTRLYGMLYAASGAA